MDLPGARRLWAIRQSNLPACDWAVSLLVELVSKKQSTGVCRGRQAGLTQTLLSAPFLKDQPSDHGCGAPLCFQVPDGIALAFKGAAERTVEQERENFRSRGGQRTWDGTSLAATGRRQEGGCTGGYVSTGVHLFICVCMGTCVRSCRCV